jgi:HSP20 family protein
MADAKKRRQFGFGFGDAFFSDFSSIFASMEKAMMEDFGRMRNMKPGPNAKVYGVSIKIGPDGKPIIEEFGNVKQPRMVEAPMPKEEKGNERVPFTDVIADKDTIKVVAEMPGVKKEDIKLAMVGKDKIEIKVKTAERQYYKIVDLEEEPDEGTIDAKYNNGVLEITMKARRAKKEEGKKPISIK